MNRKDIKFFAWRPNSFFEALQVEIFYIWVAVRWDSILGPFALFMLDMILNHLIRKLELNREKTLKIQSLQQYYSIIQRKVWVALSILYWQHWFMVEFDFRMSWWATSNCSLACPRLFVSFQKKLVSTGKRWLDKFTS